MSTLSNRQKLSEGENFKEIPLKVRILLSHAHLQNLAETVGADLLHIKGYIFGQDTYPTTRTSTDVDILVRPSHVDRLVAALKSAGWEVLTTFETGSDYHHAMTVYHPTWGLADVHRAFPGLGLDNTLTFEKLWQQRRTKFIAHFPCTTTSLIDSRILVYIHAARSTSPVKSDVIYLEELLDENEKSAVQIRVKELDAELAYAAALGTIDQYANRRDYLLWKTASQKSSDVVRWYARVKAAKGPIAKTKTIIDIFTVNRDHLAMELGHAPSPREVREKFFSRFIVWKRKGKS